MPLRLVALPKKIKASSNSALIPSAPHSFQISELSSKIRNTPDLRKVLAQANHIARMCYLQYSECACGARKLRAITPCARRGGESCRDAREVPLTHGECRVCHIRRQAQEEAELRRRVQAARFDFPGSSAYREPTFTRASARYATVVRERQAVRNSDFARAAYEAAEYSTPDPSSAYSTPGSSAYYADSSGRDSGRRRRRPSAEGYHAPTLSRASSVRVRPRPSSSSYAPPARASSTRVRRRPSDARADLGYYRPYESDAGYMADAEETDAFDSAYDNPEDEEDYEDYPSKRYRYY